MNSFLDDAIASALQVADLITQALLSPQLSAVLLEQSDLVAVDRQIERRVASTAAQCVQHGLTLGPKSVWY